MTDKALLQQILATQTLILSKLIEAENVAKGVRRIGGDYTKEAVKLAHQKTPAILQLFADTM